MSLNQSKHFDPKTRGLAVFNFFKNTWWNIYYRFINTPHQLQL